MVDTLLLEIGTEEIPAGFLKDASENLRDLVSSNFKDQNLPFSDIEIFYTPRRLVVKVDGIPGKQSDSALSITGPPKRISYDEMGNPTEAAAGFARKQNVNISELTIIENDKGEFLALNKLIKGKKSSQIIKEILSEIIPSIPFPKSMRWLNDGITFARPIRWILCMLNNKKLNINISGIKSSDKSFGHRFLHPKSIKIKSWQDYMEKLANSYVIIDQHDRKKLIRSQVNKKAEELEGKIIEDDDLLETVANIVEYPSVHIGEFGISFLEIPQEVLVSVMKTHQKYFPVYKKEEASRSDQVLRSLDDIKNKNNLIPNFVFVSGIKVDDPSKIISGNEKVIKARFSDARFFLEEDTKTTLYDNNEKLKSVTYLSEIGTYYDKVLRLEQLAYYLSRGNAAVDVSLLLRSATLCKADLVSQMVFEFPELQGVIGKYYALLSGEEPAVAIAIEEHYMPITREGELPQSSVGAFLSIIDKMDNICSCYCAGLIPSGTADPYALRRQSIGIINIIMKHNIRLNLAELIGYNLKLIRPNTESLDDLSMQVLNFIKERFRNLLLELNFSIDVIDAVITVNFKDAIESKKIIEVLSKYRMSEEFESVETAFKRVVNIVGKLERGVVNKSLLIESAEKKLYEEYIKLYEYFDNSGNSGDYDEILKKFILLRKPIDNFFDDVLVMDKDPKIRNNRLQLLSGIKMLFFRIADFSKLN